ncbi:MAG: lipoprotein-releasing ABC transporter permease subunit [Gammaproteobacteria bacterium]|nr:lipoprotein-releasing ABC transporter permease subunit [Gammaproteobacteria bacterium]
MFKPLPLYIGLRYTRAKRRNHFISFIALTSILGIALSVTVLITVLSVMNGFDEQIKERVLVMARQISLTGENTQLRDWRPLEQQLSHQSFVQGVAPYVDGQGMLTEGGVTQPVIVTGIDPQQEKTVSDMSDKFVDGSLDALTPGSFNVLLGEKLALYLGVSTGDKINLFIPQASITPAGISPRFKRFTVAGIFKVGNGFGFDSQVALINLQDAQRLFQLGQRVSGLRLKIHDLYQASQLTAELSKTFPDLYVTDWTSQYGSLFSAISLEKTMMAVILLLLVAIASFNLVSTLVMVVTEKRADIAILRTLGATPQTILHIFMIQGFTIGLLGTLLGLIFGLLLASNVTYLVKTIEHLFHVQLLSANVYYVDFLPSRIDPTDVISICSIALLMSFLAALYPARQAMKTQPAEALRYE